MELTLYQVLTLLGIPTVAGIVWKLAESKIKAIAAAQRLEEEKAAAVRYGLQALLRDRLLQEYKRFFRQGWADYDDRENAENIYKQYHALGANGVMDSYRERFLALPTLSCANDQQMASK